MPGFSMTRCLAALAASAIVAVSAAHAQAPAIPRLIKIVVPFSAGASNDVIARAIAASLAKRLDAAVIVENKAGAAGVLGADFVAKSAKDGSVLLLTSSSFLTAAATQKELPYDPLAAFAPVAMVGRGPMILVVSATTSYKSPADIVAAARAKPGVLNYGTAGVGSIAHLTTELLDDTAKIQMVHVPYKGAANAATDLAAGQIQVMISNYSTVAGLMKTGKINAVAVTSAKKHPAFPDLAPLASVAPGFNVDIWVGVFAPAGTPPAVIERLQKEIARSLEAPDVKARLAAIGAEPIANSPADFAAMLRSETAKWSKIVKDANIRAE